MDRNPNKLDSWSIPKRKSKQHHHQQHDQHQQHDEHQQAPPRSMNMAIPKKKSSNSAPPGLNMAIPRRPSSNMPPSGGPPPSLSRGIPRRHPGPPPPMDSSIPRRSSVDSNSSSHLSHPPRIKLDKVPKKKHHHHHSSMPHSEHHSPRPARLVGHTISEFPYILKIPLKGVPLVEGLSQPKPGEHRRSAARPKSEEHRLSAARTPKRKRVNYEEHAETDSDDFLTDSDDNDDDDHGDGPRALKKKKLSKKKVHKKSSSSTRPSVSSPPLSSSAAAPNPSELAALPATAYLDLGNTSMEAPPPGTLNTLWYSRECFLHVFVVEKILAWKKRAVTKLEWIPESFPEEGAPTMPPTIDSAEAAKMSIMAVTNPMIWSDPSKRMEVSRLSHQECPIVMTMACSTQSQKGPRYRIQPLSESNREEVYLVKWRGRSHMHASWERGSDIIKFDQSNNTARHKIRRFVQSQEVAFGKDWQAVLEEERKTSAVIHAHGEQTTASDTDAVEEEYYPPAVTEVERILACDESEMDLNLFAKQRGLNIKAEQELFRQKEEGAVQKWNSKEGLADLLKEAPWDPEDNVRYVVKWKSLPFAEITWEYWRDIKRDAVDEAEDFWLRQKPPDPAKVQELTSKAHPHIREFRKLQESPVYGISKRIRPVADMGQAKEDDEVDGPTGFQLRSYQLEGVNWLLFNWWNRRSCILADEMGLGKTIQSMCFLQSLQDLPATNVRGPFLIVAPLSLIGQWQSEARTWAPDLNVVLYHGSADARDFLVKQDFYYTDQFVPKATAIKLKKQHVTKFHILITTYEVVLKDIAVFNKIKWKALVVDEAHRLKNPKAKLFEELVTVPRDFCLLLTGTPLANATEELWALLHFADRKAFPDSEEFLEKFGQLTDAEQVKDLHSVLKPYLLRRVKEDVEKSLPPKEETILEVSLTPIQKKYYKAIYERNTTFLYKGSKPSNAPSLMNVMMELRKCCNHPYLVRGAEERILKDAASEETVPEGQSLDYTKLFGEQLIKSSGKMVLISKLLPKLFSNGHKVLIFSQMVRVLDLLEELLKIMRYKYERLDGSTSSSSRASAVDRFVRKSCQRFVMILSTRAGGLGLNLTAADTVIIFDSDWNPQNDLQAMARAHRIGQTRAVRVYRLLTAKTYEMHMFHSASMKLGLERAVLSQQRDQGEEESEGKSKTKSEKEAHAKEIDSLLKKGAYDVFRDDGDDEAQKFMETDIDQLLETNAQTVTYGKDESNFSSGLGSFSKASFVTDTGDGDKDVDLDDPDFWRKAVGLEAPVETPEEVAQMLDDGVKRSRKQVQQYDPYAEFAEIERKKLDKIAQKLKEEKEEKERTRLEKKRQKLLEKESRRREREEMRSAIMGKGSGKSILDEEEEPPQPKKVPKEPKIKKPKKSFDRRRAQKRVRNEDPVLERLKQAWEVPQRNRALASCLRFGFARFCKIRNESNLTSLPIQDFEVFFRSYCYQLSLQVVVTMLTKLVDKDNSFTDDKLRPFLKECLGFSYDKEQDWLCDSIASGMSYYFEIEKQKRYYRIPLVLTEPSFVNDLRRGHALRSLRRIFLLSRLHRIVEDCLDEILTELGYEQLGKRGCQASSISSLDVDLKARLVSTEELSLALNTHFNKINLREPVAWWDRSCDVALLIGTFVHGLGNYEAMLNDDSLPFSYKIRKYAKHDVACKAAEKNFLITADAARAVFDDALEAAKLKDQQQISAAVAAAAAASKKREKEALALREGGAAADAVISTMPEQPSDKLYDIEGDDSHFVTLPRLKAKLSTTLTCGSKTSDEPLDLATPEIVSSNKEADPNSDDPASRRKIVAQHGLSMPDARILDFRLGFLLAEIERNAYPEEASSLSLMQKATKFSIWPTRPAVSTASVTRTKALALLTGCTDEDSAEHYCEYLGIGMSGNQCASSHRSLDDGSDFSIGAASSELAQVAYGADAPRYLRAIGVPMNFTRFAITSLVYASSSCLNNLLTNTVLLPKTMGDEGTTSNAVGAETPKNEIILKVEPDSKVEDKTPAPVVKTEENNEMSKSHGEVSGVPDKVKSDQNKPAMPISFEENAELRSSVCAVVLHFGFPSQTDRHLKVNESLWNSVKEQCGQEQDTPPPELFPPSRFLSLVKELAGDVELPDFDVVKEYVESWLFPHCLRLCVMGNGPSTNTARGSKGEYETAYGVGVYPEYTEHLQSPLPDPCLSLGEHSLEALAAALAILRRIRLMRASVEIASGKVSLDDLNDVFQTPFMRKSMQGLPIWWCPWIHDAALLVHASTRGLFAILKERSSEPSNLLSFSRDSILKQMHASFIAHEEALPALVVDQSQPEDMHLWVERHADDFPSVNILERRLAFLCAKATETFEEDNRFENLPMFDHGAWPRN